jgi:hypothetical protein
MSPNYGRSATPDTEGLQVTSPMYQRRQAGTEDEHRRVINAPGRLAAGTKDDQPSLHCASLSLSPGGTAGDSGGRLGASVPAGSWRT